MKSDSDGVDVRIRALTAPTVLALGMVAFLLVGIPLQALEPATGLILTETLVFVGLPAAVLLRHGMRVPAALGWRPFVASDAVWALALGASNYFAGVVPIQWFSQQVFPASWIQEFRSEHIFIDKSPWQLTLILFSVCIIAPWCEETFFRGYVQPGLAARSSTFTGIVLTGVAFSALHLDPVGFAARCELGILFGICAARMGSLWPSVFAHAGNNVTPTILYFYADQSTAEKDPHFTAILASAMVGSAIVAILWAARPTSFRLHRGYAGIELPRS